MHVFHMMSDKSQVTSHKRQEVGIFAEIPRPVVGRSMRLLKKVIATTVLYLLCIVYYEHK